MAKQPSPEERAEALVVAGPRVPGGPWFVELRELVQPAASLGPYDNPSAAEEDARKIRRFLAAAIREARGG